MLSTYADCIGNNLADLTGFLQAEVQGAQLNKSRVLVAGTALFSALATPFPLHAYSSRAPCCVDVRYRPTLHTA
jgi:hypothetical protein